MSAEKNLFLEIALKYLNSVSFVMNYYASYIKVVYIYIFYIYLCLLMFKRRHIDLIICAI